MLSYAFDGVWRLITRPFIQTSYFFSGKTHCPQPMDCCYSWQLRNVYKTWHLFPPSLSKMDGGGCYCSWPTNHLILGSVCEIHERGFIWAELSSAPYFSVLKEMLSCKGWGWFMWMLWNGIRTGISSKDFLMLLFLETPQQANSRGFRGRTPEPGAAQGSRGQGGLGRQLGSCLGAVGPHKLTVTSGFSFLDRWDKAHARSVVSNYLLCWNLL